MFLLDWLPLGLVVRAGALLYLCAVYGYDVKSFLAQGRSMAPTIQPGDRVVVRMDAYRARPPERWDVLLYRYPQDPTRPYMHRLVALPGETVRILDGHLYINGQIARKPWAVQEALWRRKPGSENAASWKPDDPRHWTLADGEFTVDCAAVADPRFLAYTPVILAYEPDDPFLPGVRVPAILTADVMVQFLLEPRKVAGTVEVALDIVTEGGPPGDVDRWLIRLPVAAEADRPKLLRAGQPVATGMPYRLAGGRVTLVQVCHADRAILVRMGGREVLRQEYEPGHRALALPGFHREAHIGLGCDRGHVVFRDPSVSVDIYYTGRPDRCAVNEPFQLGEDEFFVLGDNSANANDSRMWGCVPRDHLLGKVTHIGFPPSRFGPLR